MNLKQKLAMAVFCPLALMVGLLSAWLLDRANRGHESRRARPWVVHVVHHGSIREINETPQEGE